MNKKMKVLFIARRFPPSVGGMERFAFDISEELDDQVDLRKITWGGSNKWLPLVLPWFFLRAAWRLLTDRDIAIIHTHDALQAPVGWLLHILFRRPYVIVAHGLDITYKNRFYQACVIPFVRRADAVISISKATQAEVLKRGVAAGKSHIIPLGTHDDYGKVVPNRAALEKEIGVPLGDSILLLTTGRLVKRKGVAWFTAHVLPALIKHNRKIIYLIAGEGSEREAIEAQITKHGLSEHAFLLGRVPDATRSLLYQSSDIFVMPNIVVPGDMEGFGIVVHEAATAALPVVASNIEGIVDALADGENGIMVPTRDSLQFIEKIEGLVDDPQARKRFGKKARTYTLENYRWKQIANRYVELYQQIDRR
ncbi:MAG: hypothetical protein JWM00_170 [Candidatus Saccharibacteria bacterium]|nr:hypothetical protein [Candidatus Saccharibacteria bacterium]